MPVIGEKLKVQCPFCGRTILDNGCGRTCEHCGSSPMPSYQYERSCAFYPNPKTRQESLYHAVERLRRERGVG